MHVAVICVIEAGFGSHSVGVRAGRLSRHEGHFGRVCTCSSICASSYPLVLVRPTSVGVEVRAARGLASGAIRVVRLSLAKAFMIGPWILFCRSSGRKLGHVGPLDRLKLCERVLLGLGHYILIGKGRSVFVR